MAYAFLYFIEYRLHLSVACAVAKQRIHRASFVNSSVFCATGTLHWVTKCVSLLTRTSSLCCCCRFLLFWLLLNFFCSWAIWVASCAAVGVSSVFFDCCWIVAEDLEIVDLFLRRWWFISLPWMSSRMKASRFSTVPLLSSASYYPKRTNPHFILGPPNDFKLLMWTSTQSKSKYE